MDLLDRYLSSVAALLPKDQRDDIGAELRDLLLDKIEAREAELGRPLAPAEREDLLKAFGHPIAVAGRFGARQSLIGPEVYPYWLFAVKGLLAVAVVATAIPAIVAAVLHPDALAAIFSRFLADGLNLALVMVGVATVVGAAIERGWIKLQVVRDWKVGELPRLEMKRSINKRIEALFGAVVTVLFVLWWTNVLPAPWSGAAASRTASVIAAPVWEQMRLPILALALAQIAPLLVTALQPRRVRTKAVLEIACALGGLWIVWGLWSAGRLFEVRARPGLETADLTQLQHMLDQGPRITLLVIVAFCVVKLAVEGWRLVRGAPPRVAAEA